MACHERAKRVEWRWRGRTRVQKGYINDSTKFREFQVLISTDKKFTRFHIDDFLFLKPLSESIVVPVRKDYTRVPVSDVKETDAA